MKLTPLGRDYLLAAVFLSAASLLTGEELFAGLALAMVFACLTSLLVLLAKASMSANLIASSSEVRVFKNEPASVKLAFPSMVSRWVEASAESATIGGSVSARLAPAGPGYLRMDFTVPWAGRFTDVSVEMKFRDALGLFSVPRASARVSLVVDSLPFSLIERQRRPFISPLAIGERPANSAGGGQEFYGIKEFDEQADRRDIMWKRAARHPERPLLVRMRDANIPESVSLTILRGRVAEGEKRRMTDLLCESLGVIGSSLLAAGVDPVIAAQGMDPQRVSDEAELAEGIMKASEAPKGAFAAARPRAPAEILIVVGELEDESGVEPGVPVVYIGRGNSQGDPSTVGFTGSEDLARLTGAVLAR